MGRALVAWLVLIAVESIHGVLRTLFLTPVIGDLRARQIGAAIGSVLVLGTALVFIRWMQPASGRSALRMGVLWLILTLAFEFSLGSALGRAWDQLLADYDLTRGGYMLFGLLVLALAPWVARRVRLDSH